MQNAVSDHADELASWGLGEYGEGTPQYEAKYTYQSSPSQYEPINKYGPQPYAEKYVKRADDNPVSIFRNSWISTVFLFDFQILSPS